MRLRSKTCCRLVGVGNWMTAIILSRVGNGLVDRAGMLQQYSGNHRRWHFSFKCTSHVMPSPCHSVSAAQECPTSGNPQSSGIVKTLFFKKLLRGKIWPQHCATLPQNQPVFPASQIKSMHKESIYKSAHFNLIRNLGVYSGTCMFKYF